MALTVETGEGLATADSLVSLAEVRAFASSRGETVPVADADCEKAIIRAHDYIMALESRFQGIRRTRVQALPFPRIGISLFGRYLQDGVIPATLKNAICQLVIEGVTRETMPTVDGRVVLQETVGSISTTYADNGSNANIPGMPRVDAFLAPLFGGSGLCTVRA